MTAKRRELSAPRERQGAGEELGVGIGAGEVRVEEVREEPGSRLRLSLVVGAAVLDPVEHEDPVRVLPGGLEEDVGVRSGRVSGIRVVGGDQSEDALLPEDLERLGDQAWVHPPVSVRVDQDQMGEAMLPLQPGGDVDRLAKSPAATGVHRISHRVQVGDRQDHRRVADRDGCQPLRVRVDLRVAAMDPLAAEGRLAGRTAAWCAQQRPREDPDREQRRADRGHDRIPLPGHGRQSRERWRALAGRADARLAGRGESAGRRCGRLRPSLRRPGGSRRRRGRARAPGSRSARDPGWDA